MIETSFFLPETLLKLPIWVLWRLEERKGRTTKVPYQTNGYRASATDPGTWSTYQNVKHVLQMNPARYSGFGTVLSKDYHLIFIDIDHCIDASGSLDSRAIDILDAFRNDDGNLTTYVELSQSGTGLHLILIGNIPRSFNNRKLNVEMYDCQRFIAMTGRAFSALEPCECEEGVRYVFERYKTAKNANDGILETKCDPATLKDDDWIIQHASERVGGSNKFPALFNGDWSGYSSQSEADLALCKILAFWGNNDPGTIDRIFRRSGLYRAKWERKGYRETTISTAISENNDTLFEFTRRNIRERGRASLAELSRIRH